MQHSLKKREAQCLIPLNWSQQLPAGSSFPMSGLGPCSRSCPTIGPGSCSVVSSVVADSAVLAAQLKLVGSCRGPEDRARLEQLQAHCRQLGLQDCVQFCTNVSFEELRSLLAGAVAGLHTMLDEHFGISIVEYMAAGKPAASSLAFPASLMHCTLHHADVHTWTGT